MSEVTNFRNVLTIFYIMLLMGIQHSIDILEAIITQKCGGFICLSTTQKIVCMTECQYATYNGQELQSSHSTSVEVECYFTVMVCKIFGEFWRQYLNTLLNRSCLWFASFLLCLYLQAHSPILALAQCL